MRIKPLILIVEDQEIIRKWDSNADGRRALHVNMANIRRKIESNPAMPKYILPEIGVGYRMMDEL